MEEFSDMNEAQFQDMLRNTFLDEASFLLDELEIGLLNLEMQQDKSEVMGRIFRAAHSIKGSAGAVNLSDVAAFAHIEEDCLALLRANPELITSHIVSVLLKGVDALKWRILAIKDDCTKAGIPWDVSEISSELKFLTKSLTRGEKSTPNVGEIAIGLGLVSQSAVEKAAVHQEQIRVKRIGDVMVEQGSMTPANLEKVLQVQEAVTVGKKKSTAATLKVDSDRIESILNLAGELVSLKSQIIQNPIIKGLGDSHIDSMLSQMDKNIRDLYDRTLAVRMTSLKPLFQKMQRVCRDLSEQLVRQVDFSSEGEDTELDRVITEQISDPLTHLIRNAIDHGIECVDARRSSGKEPNGRITLRAFTRSGSVVIEVSDDGAGIDRAKVFNKALEQGLIPKNTEISKLSEMQVNNFLFMPGFSTAASVTNVSGRGVGLDVVKSNIDSIRGQIEIESVAGRGSTFRMILPLTTAITDGIVVRSLDQRYVFPIATISEFACFSNDMVVSLSPEIEALNYRAETLPLFRLHRLLRRPEHSTIDNVAVITIVRGKRIAISVDAILGQSQVVLKPVDSNFAKISRSLSGAAVLDDGKVGFVLDVAELIASATSKNLNQSVA